MKVFWIVSEDFEFEDWWIKSWNEEQLKRFGLEVPRIQFISAEDVMCREIIED